LENKGLEGGTRHFKSLVMNWAPEEKGKRSKLSLESSGRGGVLKKNGRERAQISGAVKSSRRGKDPLRKQRTRKKKET